MRRLFFSRRTWLAIALFVPFFFILNCCSGVGTLYRAVTDTELDSPTADLFCTEDLITFFVPDYQVRDGKLYLRLQVARPTMLLGTFADIKKWDTETVQKFRQRHPELEPYWPDKDRPDGGIQWLPPWEVGR